MKGFIYAVLLSCIFLAGTLLTGCSSNVNRALYESIKTQNEVYKTPSERAMTPAPSYDTYQKERDGMKQPETASEKNVSPDFNLK